MNNEIRQFGKFVAANRLNSSAKRDIVVKTFFATRDHVSAEDLYRAIRKKHPEIGHTTVYRTLKLIAESGLAEVVDFGDGIRRYERKVGRDYHAHLICSRCGQRVEVFDKGIKGLVLSLARRHKFSAQKQRFEIFGTCHRCG